MTRFLPHLIPGLLALASLSGCRQPGPGPAAAEPVADCCQDPQGDPQASLASPWLPAHQRSLITALEQTVTTEDGQETRLVDLIDRPTGLIFFYTRCENPNKCARTVSHLGQLHRLVEAAGIADRVRLLAVSFEPEVDTPARLKGFGRARGLRPGGTLRLVRPDPRRHRDLHRQLDVAVNYNGGGVNLHGIGLYLFDARGRLVRNRHTLIWENDAVLTDLRRLLEEG